MKGLRGATVAIEISRRDLVRFTRQPARIAAAVGTPVLLWVFLASGFGGSMPAESLGTKSYSGFLLPGVMTLIAVFTSVFASISVIEDRQQGWLQAVMVSPAPRWSIALGKTLGGAAIAWIQAAVLLPAMLVLGFSPAPGDVLLALLALAATCAGMTATGLAFAWRCESSASFHAVMNLVLFPMWLLSGAFFPAGKAATWMRVVMAINPLTWCTESIRDPLRGRHAAAPMLVAVAFALLTLAATTWIVSCRPRP